MEGLYLVTSIIFCLTLIAASPKLEVVSKVEEQVQGDWSIRYQFKAYEPSEIYMSDFQVDIDSWLNNPTIIPHTHFKHIIHQIKKNETSTLDVVDKCKEMVTIKINGKSDLDSIYMLIEDEVLTFEIFFQHLHNPYGKYQPLLGKRKIKIKLAKDIVFNFKADLSAEKYKALPEGTWELSSISSEHLTDPPDTLFLTATLPGKQYFRLPERQTRYGTKMELSFFYYWWTGSEGEFKVRIAQYQEWDNAWKVLSDSGYESEIKGNSNQGKWIKFSKIIDIPGKDIDGIENMEKGNTMAVDFRLANSEFSIVFIQDFKLEVVDERDNTKP
jgi:hypothetical protein